jgi:hypothetical protein
MQSPTPSIGVRVLATIAGLVFLTGTLIILFEDVYKGAQFVLHKHGITLVILTGTMLVGHLMNASRIHRQWLSAVGFFVLFLAGSALVIYSSVGRQVATSTQVTATAGELSKRRAEIKDARTQAQGMLNTARAKTETLCKVDGDRCAGNKRTIDVYQAAVKGHDAELREIGEEPLPVNADAEQFAEIVAVFGADKAKVKAGSLLAAPFVITLFLEFGMIISFGQAFRVYRRPIIMLTPPATKAVEAFQPLPRGGGDGPATKIEALDDLQRLIDCGAGFGSQDELVARWGRPKGTISKWLTEWEDTGEIPARTLVGKCKQLTA